MYKSKELESYFIETINSSGKNTILGIVYRHPCMNPTLFNEDYLQPLTDNLAEQNKKIYITGDFNFDLLNTEHTETFNFFETMMSNHLLPTITVPTKINKKHSTVIDNIFTNQIHPDMKTGNLSVGISDHLISFLAVPRDNQNHMPKKNNYYVRCTKKFIREEFILDYLEIDWDVELEAHKRDTNHSTNIFFTRIEGLLDKHMPLRKMTQKEFKKRYKPWITDEIIEMINKKDAIFKKYIKAKMERRRQELHDEYKQLKNNITDLTRRKEKEHYDTYFTTNKKNLQMIWKGIKEVINIKSKSFSQPNCIIEKGTNKTITEPKEIATSFNKYFTSIAEDILNKRKYTGNKNHKEYLRNPNRSTFAVYECDPVEVENLITQLNPNKKSGPKSIPVNILQMLKKDISYPLSTIFNLSLTTGVHPSTHASTPTSNEKITPRKSRSPSNNATNMLATSESARIMLKQKVDTLETHHETLRRTICSKDETLLSQTKVIENLRNKVAAQEKTLKEQKILIDLHESIALTYMEMIVSGEDQSENIELPPDNNLHCQLKEMLRVTSQLRDDLKKSKVEVDSQKETAEENNNKYINEVQKREKAEANLKQSQEKINKKTKENSALINQVAILEDSVVQLRQDSQTTSVKAEEDRQQIAALKSKIGLLEDERETLSKQISEISVVGAKDAISKQLESALAKKEEEVIQLQEGFCFMEKSLQETKSELDDSDTSLKWTQKMWESDKLLLKDFQTKHSALVQKNQTLAQQTKNHQTQLQQTKMLLQETLRKEDKTEDEEKDGIATQRSNEEPNAEAAPPPTSQEIHPTEMMLRVFAFELLKPGSCKRGKEKCKFSHELNQYVMEEHNIHKIAQGISLKTKRCVYEMVEKGSCPNTDTCTFHKPAEKSGKPTSATRINVCHRELIEPGSCKRGSDMCRYSHDIPDQLREDAEYIRKIRCEMMTNDICINEYHKVNSCRKKDQCTFRHGIEPREREDPDIKRKMKEKLEKITKPKEKTTKNNNSIQEAITLMQKVQEMLNGCTRRNNP